MGVVISAITMVVFFALAIGALRATMWLSLIIAAAVQSLFGRRTAAISDDAAYFSIMACVGFTLWYWVYVFLYNVSNPFDFHPPLWALRFHYWLQGLLFSSYSNQDVGLSALTSAIAFLLYLILINFVITLFSVMLGSFSSEEAQFSSDDQSSPATIGECRARGIRGLTVKCAEIWCQNKRDVTFDALNLPDDVALLDVPRRGKLVCPNCHQRRYEVFRVTA